MKEIAVEGCVLAFKQGTGKITITSNPSQQCKANGKGIYSGGISFTVTNYLGGAITNGDGIGEGMINPGSKQCKAENKLCNLNGDESAEITLTGTKPAESGTETVPASAIDTVKITSPGQSLVKGE